MKRHEWDNYRKKVLIPTYIDRQWCQVCGSTEALTFHHIKFRSHGGQNTLENIILLCNKCHTKAHQHPEFNEELKAIAKGRIDI